MDLSVTCFKIEGKKKGKAMKLCTFIENNQQQLGIKVDKGIIHVSASAKKYHLELPQNMMEVINQGIKPLEQLLNKDCIVLNEKDVEFAPVLLNPEKILCVGLNYQSHQEETKMAKQAYPTIFSKFNNALAGHKQDINTLSYASQYDYEVELVIVIGKEAHDVSEEKALDVVFGYTVGNDVSARDLQTRTSQWLMGKTFDHFAPVGPYLVSHDSIDPSNLTLTTHVNGELRQKGHTSDMIFDCKYIVSYLSKYMTLKPGDIIFTGTPSGVILGYPEEKKVWLKAGDVMEVSIEGIGTLINKLI